MSNGIGDALREAREQQQRSLAELAQSVRVRTDFLRALEEERFEAFGGDVYAKGFLRQYALELGLDPEPLLDRYRREHATEDLAAGSLVSSGPVTPPSPRRRPPTWLAWAVVALAVVIGLAFVGSLGGGRMPDVASPDDAGSADEGSEDDEDGAGESEGDPDDAAADDGQGDETDESDQAPTDEGASGDPEPAIDGVELLLALEESSWLEVSVDGASVLAQTMPAGETLQYEAEEEIVITFGNAGGVRVEHNGESLGSPGSRGSVVEVTFTPEGAQTGDGAEL